MNLKHLNEINDVTILPVTDPDFRTFGRVVTGYAFAPLISYMKEKTAVPEKGNVYVPSVPEMEETEAARETEQILYGGMPIQIGYCNGRNTTYNGFEYHKGSEINIAVTDFLLVLAHVWDIRDNTIHTSDARVFYAEAGTAIEMYQTTLHLSPCRLSGEGFKDIVILPRGTNTAFEKGRNADPESELSLLKNKWVIAHPEREPLIRQGAHPGLIGANKELKY